MIVMEHRTKLYFQIYATKGAGIKKPLKAKANKGFGMLRGQDSNLRPLGYEPNELPTAPPREVDANISLNK